MEVIKEHLYAPLEITKAEDDDNKRYVKAYVTTFGNKDVVNDVIAKDALDAWIKGFDGSLPMLYGHKTDRIIGKWTKFEKDANGVIGYGEIYTDTTDGADVAKLMDRDLLKAVSIGFSATEYEFTDDGGRLFKEIELFETSIVLFPANRKAKVLDLKDEDGYTARMLENDLRDAGYSRKDATTLVSRLFGEVSKQRDAVTADAITTTLFNFKV